MLKSAIIEEKKFKHSPWAGADNPLGPRFWCQQEGLITMVIYYNLKESLQSLTLYTSFHDLINVYSHRSGADYPRGQNFEVNRNLSLWPFATSLKKISLKSEFIHFFFHDFIHVYSPGQGLTAPWGWNFDVSRNLLSVRSFVASFKKFPWKSDFIQYFSILYI